MCWLKGRFVVGPEEDVVSEDFYNNNVDVRRGVNGEQTDKQSEHTIGPPTDQPCPPKMCVIHQREPLREDSSLEEIWKVDEEMGGGMYTARYRRCHFRNYKICQQNYGE